MRPSRVYLCFSKSGKLLLNKDVNGIFNVEGVAAPSSSTVALPSFQLRALPLFAPIAMVPAPTDIQVMTCKNALAVQVDCEHFEVEALRTDWLHGNITLSPLTASLLCNNFTLEQHYWRDGILIAPGIYVLPTSSNTAPPLSTVNVASVISDDSAEALIIDPGCNIAGREALSPMLRMLKRKGVQKVTIMLTHHHHDHVDAISFVRDEFPGLTVCATSYTLERVSTEVGESPTIELSMSDTQQLASFPREARSVPLPGHTAGHTGLLCAGVLFAGDHCVGVGSSLLDASSGGNLIDYLASCNKIIDIAPSILMPAHGPIRYDAIDMMRHTIKHREDREKSILAAYASGATSPSLIVPIVYSAIAKNLWGFAQQNIQLHLDKLKQEGRI